MFHDDCVGSCEAVEQAGDQTWFAMLLVNDPNAELVGSLRPPREDALAASSEVFEGHVAGDAVEGAPRWRSRAPLWVASGLIVAALGIAAAAADALLPSFALASASAEPASPRVGSTALVARNPLASAEPVGASARPLRDLLDVKHAETPTAAGEDERGATQDKAAPTTITKKSPSRRASRSWLAARTLASR
jgi:hypothetical protein